MSRADWIESERTRLHALLTGPLDESKLIELRGGRGLGSRDALIAAKAASVALALDARATEPQLLAAFERFMANPLRTDKGCLAKAAIAKTLYDFGAECEDLYLRGARHTQREKGFGGPVDTAVELRSTCAWALVKIGSRRAMAELVNLMADPDRGARLAGVRGVVYAGREEGAMLLRLKARCGDADIEVISESMRGVMQLTPSEGLEFVGAFLESTDPAIRQAAALALGESRRPEALDFLRQSFDREPRPEVRENLLLSAAILRTPDAIDWLGLVLRTASLPDAIAALNALATFQNDPHVRSLAAAAVEERDDAAISQHLAERFKGPPDP